MLIGTPVTSGRDASLRGIRRARSRRDCCSGLVRALSGSRIYQARTFAVSFPRSEASRRGIRAGRFGGIEQPPISSVGFDTQELGIHEVVQRSLTLRLLDPIQALRLFTRQAQPRHFQKLTPNAMEQ